MSHVCTYHYATYIHLDVDLCLRQIGLAENRIMCVMWLTRSGPQGLDQILGLEPAAASMSFFFGPANPNMYAPILRI
jgi:hypothetical protein